MGANFYTPIQDVAPSAVRIAEAIDTIICTINLAVSFFVIINQNFNVSLELCSLLQSFSD